MKLYKIVLTILLAVAFSTASTAASNPSAISTVANYTSLRSIPLLAAPLYSSLYVAENANGSAGAAGNFYWNATDSRADNGATIIKPTDAGSANGRWDRQFQTVGTYQLDWFCPKTDGSADTAAYVTTALASGNATVVLGIGSYRWDSDPTIPQGS